jgi:hypothetical protein
MKYFHSLIIFMLVFGTLLGQEPKIPASTAGKSNDNNGSDFFTDDPLLDVYFMGGTPTKTVTPVDTDLGKVTMTSYMYEKSNSEVYMVATSVYPEDKLQNSDSQTLLRNAKSGFCNQLGVSPQSEKNISLDGYPGVFFKASGGENGYYAAMADYLIDNTLVQIGILRSDRAPNEKEINDFIYSIRLKNKKSYNYFTDDPDFKINFFGKEPTKSVKPVETAVGTINMITYMYNKSSELIYMVALSDYPKQYIVGSNSESLLQSTKEGYVGNMNLTITHEEKLTHKGYPGLFFKASGNAGYYTEVIDYLVDNRLYQIAILRTDRASTEEEIKEFLYSFELK